MEELTQKGNQTKGKSQAAAEWRVTLTHLSDNFPTLIKAIKLKLEPPKMAGTLWQMRRKTKWCSPHSRVHVTFYEHWSPKLGGAWREGRYSEVSELRDHIANMEWGQGSSNYKIHALKLLTICTSDGPYGYSKILEKCLLKPFWTHLLAGVTRSIKNPVLFIQKLTLRTKSTTKLTRGKPSSLFSE